MTVEIIRARPLGTPAGGSGGNTVFLGPNYGQSEKVTVGVATALSAVDIGPSQNNVGVASEFSNFEAGPFENNVGVASQFGALDAGPFENGVGVAVGNTELQVLDLEPTEDTYLDQASAQAGTPHGSSTNLLAKTSGALGNNEQITYIAWDLTGIDSGTVLNSGTEVSLYMSTSAVLGEDATLQFFTHGSKPFEEDTATWNNTQPPPGTARGTDTVALTTTASYKTVALPSASRSNMLGNWFYIKIQGTSALALATITTQSKEAANAPQLDLRIRF